MKVISYRVLARLDRTAPSRARDAPEDGLRCRGGWSVKAKYVALIFVVGNRHSFVSPLAVLSSLESGADAPRFRSSHLPGSRKYHSASWADSDNGEACSVLHSSE